MMKENNLVSYLRTYCEMLHRTALLYKVLSWSLMLHVHIHLGHFYGHRTASSPH